jgi:thioredoxin
MKHTMLKNPVVQICLGALLVIVVISLGAVSEPGSVRKPPNVQECTDSEEAGQSDIAAATEQHGKVHLAGEANFAELTLNSDVPVLVSFYADWCGPCQTLAPVLQELARDTKGARIVKVNVDENPNLAARYKITSIPSLRVFKDGEVVDEHVGLTSKAELKKMLDT